MLFVGLCVTLWVMPLASTGADPASKKWGSFLAYTVFAYTYEYSQRKNTFA